MTSASLNKPARTSNLPGDQGGRFQRLLRLFGALQLALVLLPLFAGVLALGMFVESIYDTKAAHQLVYNTWWFAGLLALLSLNIACAAIKKRPWKKQQTGFLITHAGLMTLVVGGLATNLLGIHGMVMLIDTEDVRFFGHGLPATSTMVDPVHDRIRVRGPRDAEIHQRVFDPGAIAWSPNHN